jgi:hypothetical protein
MPSERHSFAPLESAKYFVEEPEQVAAAESEAAEQAAPKQRGGLEQAFKWINPLVIGLLVVVAGTWYWQNQSSVSSGAGKFRRTTANPFNFLLWLKGVDYTVEDVVAEHQRQFKSQFGNFESAFSSEQFQSQFKPIDLNGLIYQPNGPIRDTHGY